ncbi:Kazal-type serine protease inhibitor family protein [Candidatus Electronema sp. PJ]|uniref:Kazal-type serine protease inhibitor family protein n=1 Tax=Candidatus Electronema sp. PJ TaxID=3401572 RepID=UPI003AA7E1E4
MNKLMAVLLSGCALLLLAGCPKPGGNGTQPNGKFCGGVKGLMCPDDQYCEFQYCGLTDAPQGICKTKPQVCTKDYKPVCDCDGRTHSNACEAARAGVNIAHEGKCPAPMCGGIANIQCPNGLTCVDDPDDNCNPAQGGADCSGVCVKP